MSEFSRETLLNIIETDHVQCGEASALARMALAAMDSEPVIVVGDDGGDALSYRRLIQSFEPGTQLYRHAQQPVVPEEMTPEMMRAVQLNSELGAYAASNLSGAYDLFAEFWKVACRAAMINGGKP